VHAESAPGQLEFVLEYASDNAVPMADAVFLARETLSEIAHQMGMKAIFLPKMSKDNAGNGLHLHMSITDLTISTAENNMQLNLADTKGKSFLEGALKHLPALLALTIPTTNSFRRVGPGCWTGFEGTWGLEDKEAPIRVVSSASGSWEHYEYKLCDSSANLHLAMAGIISAGLDGMKQNMELRPSRQDAIPDEKALLPSTIIESLSCLEQDEVLRVIIPEKMMKAYLPVRRAEAARDENMTIKEQLEEALKLA
jgi:glutamine synthetase